jgi:mono/diheme cytochrome c family protein
MKTFLTRRVIIHLLRILALASLGFVAYAWRSTIPPIDPPAADSFEADSIRHGAQLAALGDCATCHTAPGGETFAGGRAVPTPFGPVYSTNITPDTTSGIGRWSREAFQRALREGVDREGTHLYPAFPYDHFTFLNDEDAGALYAFMMTREPVPARTPENHLPFPLNVRFILAAWKLLFFHKGPYVPDATHDEQWNRGAYLANGIGHCGACHTPRNTFGAEISAQHFGGGEVEGWHAYAMNSNTQASEPWDTDALHVYLRQGWHPRHGNAFGAMATVTPNLAPIPDTDVKAIAAYVVSVMGKRTEPSKPSTGTDPPSNDTGAAIYASACAHCHDGVRPLPFGGIELTSSTAVTGDTATNLIKVVLEGIRPPEGAAAAIMPGFANTLTDGQLESLIAYIRSNFGAKPPWTGVETGVREARSRDRD